MRTSSRTYAAATAALSIFATVDSARGQDATPTEEGSFGLEQVTVTARRVNEDLQKTPVAITAFTPEGLERKQLFRTDDLDQSTPNMVFDSSARLAGNSSAVVITIR